MSCPTVEYRKISTKPKCEFHILSHLRQSARECSHIKLQNPLEAPRDKLNPLGVAKQLLGPRLEERGGSLFLDRVPTNITRIMQATNAILKESGIQQITYNEGWRV